MALCGHFLATERPLVLASFSYFIVLSSMASLIGGSWVAQAYKIDDSKPALMLPTRLPCTKLAGGLISKPPFCYSFKVKLLYCTYTLVPFLHQKKHTHSFQDTNFQSCHSWKNMEKTCLYYKRLDNLIFSCRVDISNYQKNILHYRVEIQLAMSSLPLSLIPWSPLRLTTTCQYVAFSCV